MERKDIEKLFPRKCLITQELIDSKKNIGTELLRTFVPESVEVFWGLSIGNVESIKIKTEKEILHEGKKMTVPFYLDRNITSPTEVEFKLRKQ